MVPYVCEKFPTIFRILRLIIVLRSTPLGSILSQFGPVQTFVSDFLPFSIFFIVYVKACQLVSGLHVPLMSRLK
jgi:hypothetical protein